MGSRSDKTTLLTEPVNNGIPLWVPLLVIAVGVVAYLNSFGCELLFDDKHHIIKNMRIRALWPPWAYLSAKRPTVEFTFAINYAIHGLHVFGYHLVNLSIHILAALTLMGIVRRTAERVGGDCSPPNSARWIALAVALLWVVHPLQTQAVTYVVQRGESLMGLFYLLTLYCVIRATSASNPRGWQVIAIAACALGMGSKAVMCTAPVVIFIYDALFLSGSVGAAWRKNRVLYVGLAACWIVLWANGLAPRVLDFDRGRGNIGFGILGVTPLQYALTEPGVILHYLKLSVWPHPLCFDYLWPWADSIGRILPQALVIAALLVGTFLALRKRRWLGFSGIWFFFILAPTSSFVPIRDALFEHRMYLSLAGVLVVIVVSVHALLTRLQMRGMLSASAQPIVAGTLMILATTSLAWATHQRNKIYENEVIMWRDVIAKRPASDRGWENYGTALNTAGRTAEALPILQKAWEMNPSSFEVVNGIGFALVSEGQIDEGIPYFHKALQINPAFARAHYNLGKTQDDLGRPDQAMAHYRDAIEQDPDMVDALLNLGNAFLARGRSDEAIANYRHIIELEPDNPSALGNLGTALIGIGKSEQAKGILRHALKLSPENAVAHNRYGIALASSGQLKEAIPVLEKSLALDPTLTDARNNLGRVLMSLGRRAEAEQHFRLTLRINPDEAVAHYMLGTILEDQGKRSEAIAAYQEALRVRPGYNEAREALERIKGSNQ